MRPFRSALFTASLLFSLVSVAAAQDTARIAKSLDLITEARDNDGRRDAIVGQLRASGVEPVVEPFAGRSVRLQADRLSA